MRLRPRIGFLGVLLAGALTNFGGVPRACAEATSAPEVSAVATEHLRAAQRHLAHAKVQQKFAVAERGNILGFDAALGALASAERQTQQAQSTGPSNWPELSATIADIRALRAQIEQLRQTAESWFSGRFPLVRGLRLTNFEDDEEPAVIFGPSGRAAASRGARCDDQEQSIVGSRRHAFGSGARAVR